MSQNPKQFAAGTFPQSGGRAVVRSGEWISAFSVIFLAASGVLAWLSRIEVCTEANNEPIRVPFIAASVNIAPEARPSAGRVIRYRRGPPHTSGKGDTLAAPLREFLDRCIVPALVDKYFAEKVAERDSE